MDNLIHLDNVRPKKQKQVVIKIEDLSWLTDFLKVENPHEFRQEFRRNYADKLFTRQVKQ